MVALVFALIFIYSWLLKDLFIKHNQAHKCTDCVETCANQIDHNDADQLIMHDGVEEYYRDNPAPMEDMLGPDEDECHNDEQSEAATASFM